MITVIFYGLDEFVVGRLSRELGPLVAKLYEVNEEEVVFVGPNNMLFHNGVEQTSWNILMHVHAPKKVSVLEDQMASLLLEGIGEVAIHKTVEFYYYSQDNRHTKINKDYPRFIKEDNLVDIDQPYTEKEEGEGEDEIFTGNIFEGLED